ncbi:endonuclease domain-containing protein [Mycobacteroides abscessus]|uniref:endonuclease domain-containing protein n=1 Tax=Mycobacteroides abscessus TaxID=36809 RepID=UPI0009AB591D
MSAKLACVDCGQPQKARNLCQHHYDKLRRSGKLSRVNSTRTDVLKRDASGNKLCVRCRAWKPESEYYSNVSRKDGLAPYCASCMRVFWVEGGRDKKYGLEPGSVKALFEMQGYVCAICRIEIDESAHVDHDHSCCPSRGQSCGKCVRGILCKPCNLLLGNVNDSMEKLAAAIEYLKRWGK